MAITNLTTDRGVLAALGDRISRHRLNRNLTQEQLAREAGVSKRTVARLESGESTQMTNLIRMLRALGLLERLDAFIPDIVASPVEALKAKKGERRRASPKGHKSKAATEWSWGDEDDEGEDKR